MDHFYQELYQYITTIKELETEKAVKAVYFWQTEHDPYVKYVSIFLFVFSFTFLYTMYTPGI